MTIKKKKDRVTLPILEVLLQFIITQRTNKRMNLSFLK